MSSETEWRSHKRVSTHFPTCIMPHGQTNRSLFTLWVIHIFHHYHELTKCMLEGWGSKADVCFFKNLKMMTLFQQNHHFNAFLFVCFCGEGGGLQKSSFCMLMKMMKKWMAPYFFPSPQILLEIFGLFT